MRAPAIYESHKLLLRARPLFVYPMSVKYALGTKERSYIILLSSCLSIAPYLKCRFRAKLQRQLILFAFYFAAKVE
jgi:hypothetical protein